MMFTVFSKRPADTQSIVAGSVEPMVEAAVPAQHDTDGLRWPIPEGLDTADWLTAPYRAGPALADLGARLAQLALEGLAHPRQGDVFLPWDGVYALLASPDLRTFREPLGIPPDASARPRIANRGGLLDADFALLLAEWVDPHGRPLRPAPRLVGAVLEQNGSTRLLPEAAYRLTQELARFHKTPVAQRDREFRERAYGRMRRLALQCGAPLSDYVAQTVVLTPDRLRLALRRGEGATPLVEVVPGFDEAPPRWLEMFDRLPLQAQYEIPDGATLTRVLPSAEVSAVLAEIKRMPGRRAAGARAEAFVRNPYAVLGQHAAAVIDPEQFEAAREEAGIRFERFTPRVERDAMGAVCGAGLLIESLFVDGGGEARYVGFSAPDELSEFTARLRRRVEQGAPCCLWQGWELEILGDTPEHLAELEAALRQWQQPRTASSATPAWRADEVLDLSRYAERVEGIGQERPLVVPDIDVEGAHNAWFDGAAEATAADATDGGSAAARLLQTFGDVPSLEAALRAAEQAGHVELTVPGLALPVGIDLVRAAVDELRRTLPPPPPHDDTDGGGGRQSARSRLLIGVNFDDLDYAEARAQSLDMSEGRPPQMPAALRPEIVLKEHQHVGVAWLQHLWDLSPHACRGTVLADDMGLGKTLQLLTFIVSCFEREPDLPPALVVAPVALLENWRNELEKFFAPGTLPVLTLYGDALRALRVSRDELDDELQRQGITRLLKKGWRGEAKLVLTTYETMRDLEFALAGEAWSVMVCDEAQKIKTPAAMVTRSAKKQKVRFRIACTGTPVENTLADLWCLFDFVQPGMLGALSQFSRSYRRPIEAKTPDQVAKVEELRAIVKPQLLHRKKTEVARDLPPLIEDEHCKRLPMSAYQTALYERALATLREQRETNPSAQLQALLAIRQICSDPHGYAEPDARTLPIGRLVDESPKMGWLVGWMKRLAADEASGHKVIVFCEFRELQLTLQRVIAAFFGFAPHVINGDTSADPQALTNRQKLIDDFQRRPGFGAIVLSPLAVGFGVNVQAANHVVHFTRTWNPAKEDQATARAWRIGQTRPVTVYYPGVVTEHYPSFDVTLDRLLSRKRELAADMLNGCSELRAEDFVELA